MDHNSHLLYSIPGIKAYHIEDGHESDLTPSGPQALSMLMVSEPSQRSHTASKLPGEPAEQDCYLHLHLPPELDLPLPATTQIFHQPPRSYLIPRWDGEHDEGAFTRIEFPPLGRGVQQEDIDTFETILAQCTAFLERAEPPPTPGFKEYNPGDYKPGQAYALGTGSGAHGQVVLVDEENGSVVGELAGEDAEVIESPGLKPGQKDPVEITISQDGKRIIVSPLSEDYLDMARHPAYKDSSLVQNAAAASRLIVTTSDYLANLMASGAENFTVKTKPQKPITFTPAAQKRARKVNSMTQSAAELSAKTVGQATKIAQNVGATLARRGERSSKKGPGEPGKEDDYKKPGLLNKSMIAFSTLADGVAVSGKHLLASGGNAATSVVGHRYGDDARKVTAELTRSVTNVGLVYIDVTGVSRRAVLKSVAKGMIVGKVKGKGNVVVGGGDGGEMLEGLPAAGPSGEPPKYTPGDYKDHKGGSVASEKYS